MRKYVLWLVAALFAALPATAQKREFRGAWIQCVNGQFEGMSRETMQKELTRHLDALQQCHANAVFFQVRPECDALYQSPYEPWSRFLTGTQGRHPGWDPLAWMVQECHKRGMELHAWINPFRAKTKNTKALATTHISQTHPERIFKYDGLYILNPGQKVNRDYICQIAADIVSRYDVDGLHIDDYFYPYPAAGQTIPDQAEFSAYNNGFSDIRDWRRDNVNVFIKQLSETVHKVKPWVKFGVSPFGIYRNQKSDPRNGSATNGLQNYDDLYADVLLWVNNGWVDYNVPQLYWEIGHKAADYETLIRWWNRYSGARPLYIGEDIERTVKAADRNNPASNQMPAKYRLHRESQNVKGTCLWYSRVLANNFGNYATVLRDVYWKNPALQPEMTFLGKKSPKKPKKLKVMRMDDGKKVLFWTAKETKKWQTNPSKFAVYRFKKGETINIDDPSHLCAITYEPMLVLPDANEEYTYAVTALNRIDNESKYRKIRVR